MTPHYIKAQSETWGVLLKISPNAEVYYDGFVIKNMEGFVWMGRISNNLHHGMSHFMSWW